MRISWNKTDVNAFRYGTFQVAAAAGAARGRLGAGRHGAPARAAGLLRPRLRWGNCLLVTNLFHGSELFQSRVQPF